VGDGILTVDPQGKIESFNTAAQSILGFTDQEAIITQSIKYLTI